MHGFNGKLLRVNLTEGTIQREEPGENFYRTYFGGSGFVGYFLLNEIKPGIDPLGPENKLIFAPGGLTGMPLPGTGRHSVGAKSPLTGGFGDSQAGGHWGAELKRAGWDAIVVEGQSDHPVYLSIRDDRVELRDAGHLWGKKTLECQETLREELGDKNIKVAQIGIAGENMVRYACIGNDMSEFAGRTGMGAVMGSKRLKAIAVRGTKNPQTADPARVKSLSKWMAQNYMDLAGGMAELGTARTVMANNIAGGLPTLNYQRGTFEGAEAIDGTTMRDTILVGRDHCYACPIRCKRVVQSEANYRVDPKYGGPEYETLGSFGSMLGIDDLELLAYANQICNAYTLDTISAGVTIAWAMECYENGILTQEDTGGLDLHFGNKDVLIELIEQISHRTGFGALLAEGSKRASEKIGRGSEEFALHVKGQELPMHEPRFKQALGVGYAVSPTGADHCHNVHDHLYEKESRAFDDVKSLGLLEPMPSTSLGPKKARLLYYISNFRHFQNCGVYCYFVPWSVEQSREIVEAVTGWNTSQYEILKIGERAATMARLFNIREGFDVQDDKLPNRFFKPLPDGALKGVALNPDDFEETKADYYEMMGWNRETGIPTRGRLQELGVDWALPVVSGS